MKNNLLFLSLFICLFSTKPFVFGQAMTVELTAAKYNVCPGEDVELTVIGTDRPADYFYYIYDETGTQVQSRFAAGEVTLVGITTTRKYHIRVYDNSAGQKKFITPHSNEITITVTPSPTYTLTGPGTACLNSSNNVEYNFTISPYRSTATYSLHYMDGTDEENASGIFTHLGAGVFSYNITNDIGGQDFRYFIKATENGCTVKSNEALVKYRDMPTGIEETPTELTEIRITKTDIPYVLNKLLKEINIPDETTLEFDDHLPENDAVIKNSDGTYSFNPSRVTTTGDYQVDYILTKDGCTARYLLKLSIFKVLEPSTNLPSFLKVEPPHTLICENENAVTLSASVNKICRDGSMLSPLSLHLTYRSGYTLKPGERFERKDDFGNDIIEVKAPYTARDAQDNYVYKFTIDPLQHVPGQYSIFIEVEDNECGLAGNIPIYARRNPLLTGLPAVIHNTEEILICSASNDTLYVRGNPLDGSYNFYHGTPDPATPGTYTYTKFINGLGIHDIEERSLVKFTPHTIFADSLSSAFSDVIKIVYTYPKDANGACPDSVTRILKFLPPVPVTFIRPDKICFGETVPFTVNGSSDPADKFSWNFGDGFSLKFDTATTVKRKYLAPGKYGVRFKTQVATLDPTLQCNNDIIDSIRIGTQPSSDFDVYKNYIDKDTATRFHSLAIINDTSITDKDPIVKWEWKIDPPFDMYQVSDRNPDTSIVFHAPSLAPYKVLHIATAKTGCTDTSVKYVPVFKLHRLDKGESKLDTFGLADTDNSWFESGEYLHLKQKSSWANTFPNEKSIKGTSDRGNAWITNKNPHPNAGYYNNEKSYVESPVYDLRKLELPMLTLDTWTNFDYLFDGAALQYTYCDSIPFGKEKWYTLGVKDKGLNWYNSNSIIGEPGGRFDGWTNTTDKAWNLSAYRLDLNSLEKPLADTSHNFIRFRIVLGTNNDNMPGGFFDGFAFDNFYVGERNRKVIVEEFCDYQHYKEDIHDIFKDPQAIRIQYHVGTHTKNDSINLANRAEPSARALHYGIGKGLPRIVLDGILSNNFSEFNKWNDNELLEWGQDDFLKRSLYVSPFKISVDPVVENDKLKITSTVENISTLPIKGPFVVQVAVLEREVYSNELAEPFTNVLRNMVPNAAGNRIRKNYFNEKNDTTFTLFWSPFVKPTSDILVVVFIQDEDTKEIYQSEYDSIELAEALTLPLLRPRNSTGNNIPTFNEVTLSPNPTSGNVNLLFNGILIDYYTCTISDSYGKVLRTEQLDKNISAAMISTSELTSGLYYLTLEGQGQRIVKKFSVIK